MGNIVDGIQRPLRVRCLFMVSTSLDALADDPGAFKVNLYSTRHQCRGSRPLSQMGLYSLRDQGEPILFAPKLSSRPTRLETTSLVEDIFGTVWENSLVDKHKMMLSPRAMGSVTRIAEKGSYTVEVGDEWCCFMRCVH